MSELDDIIAKSITDFIRWDGREEWLEAILHMRLSHWLHWNNQ